MASNSSGRCAELSWSLQALCRRSGSACVSLRWFGSFSVIRLDLRVARILSRLLLQRIGDLGRALSLLARRIDLLLTLIGHLLAGLTVAGGSLLGAVKGHRAGAGGRRADGHTAAGQRGTRAIHVDHQGGAGRRLGLEKIDRCSSLSVKPMCERRLETQ